MHIVSFLFILGLLVLETLSKSKQRQALHFEILEYLFLSVTHLVSVLTVEKTAEI